MMAKRRLHSRQIPSILLLAALASMPSTGRAEDGAGGEGPEKIQVLRTWERIVNIPGWILRTPFKILFDGIEWLVPRVYVPGKVGPIYDFFTSDDGLRALRPKFSTTSGLGLKLYQKDLFNEGSKISLRAAMGLDLRQKYQVQFERFRLFSEAVYTDLFLTYRKRVNESFYGIGGDTHEDDRTSYLLEQTSVFWRVGVRILPNLDLSGSVLYEFNNIFDGVDKEDPGIREVFSLGDLPGLENRVRMLHSRAELRYDSRDIPGAARSGREILLGGGYGIQAGGDTYGFYKLNADIRQYVHLFFNRRLVFRVAGEITRRLPQRIVPFYHLSELGRSETIRGYRRGRFRDLDMVLCSVEYHYPIWSRFDINLDAFLFFDAGQVSSDILTRIGAGESHTGYGFGFRAWKTAEELGRLMLGFSREHVRIYLTVGI